MKTPKEYHYTYYSYEEYGRGYIGVRSCKCPPEEDVQYFGSYTDGTFNPTHKVILKDDYATREEANLDEIILHDYYDVGSNLYFANKCKAISTGFYVPGEKAIENGKLGGKVGGLISKENNLGFFSLPNEKRKEASKKGGINAEIKNKENGTGLYGLTAEERIEYGRRGGITNKNNKTGFFSMTNDRRTEISRENGNKTKELGLGIFARTKEQMAEDAKKSVETHRQNKTGAFDPERKIHSKGGKSCCSQRWQCIETGFITNPGNLTKYQRARGIDTSKRIRIS
jgi:hypothetical protein